jgi:hypothetical protein
MNDTYGDGNTYRGVTSAEILRVTPEGEFIWHEDADKLIEESDFSNSPSLPHILRALRIQTVKRKWAGLTDAEIMNLFGCKGTHDSDINAFKLLDASRIIEAKLKEKNT